MAILSRDELEAQDEETVFSAVMRWCSAQPDRLSNLHVVCTIIYLCFDVIWSMHNGFWSRTRIFHSNVVIMVRNVKLGIHLSASPGRNAPSRLGMLVWTALQAEENNAVTQFLTRRGTEIVPHLAFGSDLPPNDFYLHPALKRMLKGRRFSTLQAIHMEVIFIPNCNVCLRMVS